MFLYVAFHSHWQLIATRFSCVSLMFPCFPLGFLWDTQTASYVGVSHQTDRGFCQLHSIRHWSSITGLHSSSFDVTCSQVARYEEKPANTTSLIYFDPSCHSCKEPCDFCLGLDVIKCGGRLWVYKMPWTAVLLLLSEESVENDELQARVSIRIPRVLCLGRVISI